MLHDTAIVLVGVSVYSRASFSSFYGGANDTITILTNPELFAHSQSSLIDIYVIVVVVVIFSFFFANSNRRDERTDNRDAQEENGRRLRERCVFVRFYRELSTENWATFGEARAGARAVVFESAKIYRRSVFVLRRGGAGFGVDIFREANGDGEKEKASTEERESEEEHIEADE